MNPSPAASAGAAGQAVSRGWGACWRRFRRRRARARSALAPPRDRNAAAAAAAAARSLCLLPPLSLSLLPRSPITTHDKPQVLTHFWDLASLDPAAREKAAAALVAALVAAQREHEQQHMQMQQQRQATPTPTQRRPQGKATAAGGGRERSGSEEPQASDDDQEDGSDDDGSADGSDEDDDDSDGEQAGGAAAAGPAPLPGASGGGPADRQRRLHAALDGCAPLLTYGLRRLARGLASGRAGARQGFAVALAAVLAAAAAAGPPPAPASPAAPARPLAVDARGVLALLDASLEVTGSMKASVSVRRLFAVSCGAGRERDRRAVPPPPRALSSCCFPSHPSESERAARPRAQEHTHKRTPKRPGAASPRLEIQARAGGFAGVPEPTGRRFSCKRKTRRARSCRDPPRAARRPLILQGRPVLSGFFRPARIITSSSRSCHSQFAPRSAAPPAP